LHWYFLCITNLLLQVYNTGVLTSVANEAISLLMVVCWCIQTQQHDLAERLFSPVQLRNCLQQADAAWLMRQWTNWCALFKTRNDFTYWNGCFVVLDWL